MKEKKQQRSAALIAEDCEELKTITKIFIESYEKNQRELPFEQWLSMALTAYLPDMGQATAEKLCTDVFKSIQETEARAVELKKTVAEGRSRDKWLIPKVRKIMSAYTAKDAGKIMLTYYNTLLSTLDKLSSRGIGIPSVSTARGTASLDINWNRHTERYFTMHINRLANILTASSVRSGHGMDLAYRYWDKEEVKAEFVKNSLLEETDFDLKAILACVCKAGTEKGSIHVFKKGVSMETLTDIAYLAVEQAKALEQNKTGIVSLKQAMERIQQASTIITEGVMEREGLTELPMVFGVSGLALEGYLSGACLHAAGHRFAKAAGYCNWQIEER